MLTAINTNGSKVMAWQATGDSIYKCQICKTDVNFQGGVFVHRDGNGCPYADHQDSKTQAKLEIYRELLKVPQACSNVILEDAFDDCMPDITFHAGSYRVAIELRKKSLAFDEFRFRMNRYIKRKIFTLWILVGGFGFAQRVTQTEHVFKIKEMHKFLHSGYYGRTYWYCGQLNVAPVYLDDNIPQSAEGIVANPRRYGDLLRKVVTAPQKTANLLSDFKPVIRKQGPHDRYGFDDMALWIDKYPIWWTKVKDTWKP